MKLKHIISTIAGLVLGLSVTSCSPDEFDMPDKNVAAGDLVEGIAYTVTHDSNNPNIVYLDSKMPQGYTVYWDILRAVVRITT